MEALQDRSALGYKTPKNTIIAKQKRPPLCGKPFYSSYSVLFGKKAF